MREKGPNRTFEDNMGMLLPRSPKVVDTFDAVIGVMKARKKAKEKATLNKFVEVVDKLRNTEVEDYLDRTNLGS